jgi:DNA-binding HxlR family transcriptional regulator
MGKRQHTPASAAVGIEHAIRMLEGRWKVVILFHLFAGRTLRFSDLERAIPAVSQKMLIQPASATRARRHHRAHRPRTSAAEGRVLPDQVGPTLCPALDELLTWAEKQPLSPSSSQSVKATRRPRG